MTASTVGARSSAFMVGAAMLLTSVLVFEGIGPEMVTIQGALLAASFVGFAGAAGWYYLATGQSRFPFIEYAAVHFALLFAVPLLWVNVSINAWRTHQPYLDQALLLVALCGIFLFLGYRAAVATPAHFISGLRTILPEVTTETESALWLLTGVVAISLAVSAMSNLAIATEGLGPLAFALKAGIDPYFFFSIIVFVRYARGSADAKAPMWAAFALLLIYGVAVAQVHAMLKPFIVVFLARWMYLRRFTKSFVLLALAGFLIINPIKNEYRRALTQGTQLSVTSVIDAWTGVFQESRNADDGMESTKARLNELAYVANAVEAVPHDVSYQYGYPWRSILIAIIPRVIWEEKPDLRRIYPTEWAVQFGYIQPFQHEQLAVNLPLPVDGYWNFGVPGVVFVGFLVGIALGLLTRICRLESCFLFALGMALFTSIHVNNSLGSTVGDLPFRFVLLSLAIVGLNVATEIGRIIRQGARRP